MRLFQYKLVQGGGKLLSGSCRCIHRNGRKKYCTVTERENKLLPQLAARIRLNGPITVAEYMREVLTNPTAGYYMHRDVFGTKGDFTTSPEISQMFGELIGVWCVNEWQQCGSPPEIQVVELGPGRGTLADDMLRVFAQFGIKDAVSVHLVEVSPKLSEIQREKLTGARRPEQNENSSDKGSNSPAHYAHCTSKHGPEVFWYKELPQVPRKFSFYVAHEFFDALPIHKFQKKDSRWCEVLVDVSPSTKSPEVTSEKTSLESLSESSRESTLESPIVAPGETSMESTALRYVLTPGETAASKLLLPDALQRNESREHIEVCPDSAVLVQEIANRVAVDGGFALIADYGHTGEKSDTFRAFRDHKLHDPLVDPGSADLTADVDFEYLSKMVSNRAAVYGPVTQESFLYNMGIGYRLQALLSKADTKQRKSLITGYDMMCNPSKMGERFKFLALSRHRPGNQYKPAGFASLETNINQKGSLS